MSFDSDGSVSGYDARGNEVVPLDTMLPSLLMRVPQIPYEIAVDMLRIKYMEFVRRTGNIRWQLLVNTQAGVRRYPLPIPDGYFLFSIPSVRFTIAGQPGQYYQTLPNPNLWQNWQGMYRGTHYCIDQTNHFVLDVAPKQETQLWVVRVNAQLVPRTDCQMMPADVQAAYGDDIAAGAAGEAMNNRQKPWYDPGNSVRMTKQFYAAVGDARANVERDKQGAAYMRTRRWI
jgi:hypothetical protein